MIILLVCALAFALPVALYAPAPASLHEVAKPGVGDRIRSAAGTLSLGLVIIIIAMMTFDSTLVIDPRIVSVFALSRPGIFEYGYVFQLLSANLLHFDLVHLAANLFFIVLLSAYERRVPSRRYLAVFWVSAVISCLAVLLMLPPEGFCLGSSGGICGLAAAFFLDYREVNKADWIKGSLMVLFLVGLYSVFGASTGPFSLQGVEIGAHLTGALAGAIYVYLIS